MRSPIILASLLTIVSSAAAAQGLPASTMDVNGCIWRCQSANGVGTKQFDQCVARICNGETPVTTQSIRKQTQTPRKVSTISRKRMTQKRVAPKRVAQERLAQKRTYRKAPLPREIIVLQIRPVYIN